MRSRNPLLVLLTIISSLLLIGCESIAQAQQQQPTLDGSVPQLSSTTEIKPTDVPGIQERGNSLSNSGVIVNPDLINDSGSKITGKWTSGDQQLTISLLTGGTQGNVEGMVKFQGVHALDSLQGDCILAEEFSYQNQVITWGTTSLSCKNIDMVPPGSILAWTTQPTATYSITITHEVRTSSLVFSLIGEDPVEIRRDLLDGRTYTRINVNSIQP